MTKLLDPKKFFDKLRIDDMLGPELTKPEVDGVNLILEYAGAAGWQLADTAYALATAYHETNHTMEPVREAYWISEAAAMSYARRMYDINGQRPHVARQLGNTQPGDGAKFLGRGFPQTTGRANYTKAEKIFGDPFVAQPQLMMVPRNAAKVMVRFMQDGLYTTKKLADFLPRSGPATRDQFIKARRVINGSDRAGDIAVWALRFQTALQLGQWG